MSATAAIGEPRMRAYGVCGCVTGPGPWGCNACGAQGWAQGLYPEVPRHVTPIVTYTSNATTMRTESPIVRVPAMRLEEV